MGRSRARRDNPFRSYISHETIDNPIDLTVRVLSGRRGERHKIRVMPSGAICLLDHPKWKLHLARENARVALLPDGALAKDGQVQLCTCYFVFRSLTEWLGNDKTPVGELPTEPPRPCVTQLDGRHWGGLEPIPTTSSPTLQAVESAGFDMKARNLRGEDARTALAQLRAFKKMNLSRTNWRDFETKQKALTGKQRIEAVRKEMINPPGDSGSYQSREPFSVPSSGTSTHPTHLLKRLRQLNFTYRLAFRALGDCRVGVFEASALEESRQSVKLAALQKSLHLVLTLDWRAVCVADLFDGLALHAPNRPTIAVNRRVNEGLCLAPYGDGRFGVQRFRFIGQWPRREVVATTAVFPLVEIQESHAAMHRTTTLGYPSKYDCNFTGGVNAPSLLRLQSKTFDPAPAHLMAPLWEAPWHT